MPDKPQIITRQRQISGVRASTWDAKAGTFEAVIASERPVPMYDWETGETVDEILLAAGMKMPGRLKQVPLQDSHSRRSILDTIGSVRNIRPDNDVVIGEAHLNLDTQRGKAAAVLVSAGDLTDLSVGYEFADKDVLKLKAGETKLVYGREYSGPANVMKKWTLKEVSLVAIGADIDAKIRAEPQDCEGSNAPDASHLGNDTPALGEGGLMEERTMEPEPKTPASPEAGGAPPVTIKAAEPIDLAAIRAEGVKAERERCAAIREFGAIAGTKPELIESLISDGKTQTEARAAILADKRDREKIPTGTPYVEVTGDARETFRKHAIDSMLVRAGILSLEKAEKGCERFVRHRMMDLLRESLELRGIRTGTTPTDQLAMLEPRTERRLTTRELQMLSERGSAPGAVGVDDFPNVTLSAANKAAGIGFNSYPATWQKWCRKRIVSSFADQHVIKISGFDLLPELTDDKAEVSYLTSSDVRELWSSKQYAGLTTISDKAVTEDDLSIFRIPFRLGRSEQYTIENMVYYVLLSNPTLLENAIALFHANRGNYVAAGTQPTTAALTAAFSYFQLVEEPNGEALGLNPSFLLAPVALKTAIDTYIVSPYLSGQTNPVPNPYANWVQPIYVPLLSKGATIKGRATPTQTGSATAWYVVCGPDAADTIEVGFVNTDQPLLESDRPLEWLGTRYRIAINAGCGPVDWRGMYRNDGTGA